MENKIKQIIEEQDKKLEEGYKKGRRLSFLAKGAKDEIKNYIVFRDKAILEGVIEMIKEKLRIINDYPLYNDFVKGEKSACREILQHLTKKNMKEEEKQIDKLYDEFIKNGLAVGFTDDQIDFLWSYVNKVASRQALTGGFLGSF